ncbi:unnamed protein product [Callosobruchus maculatus]|uniref:THAP-type domain-containing protein n=1 Tax=Callosobruchus maculatus TaxID=64391 RepID=A0A653CMC0_CALMS|nr:unnamed protein product [Callosobruchus maculatus]
MVPVLMLPITMSELSPSTSALAAQDDSPRKKKLRRELLLQKDKNKETTKKIRALGQSLKRAHKKVASLKIIAEELERQNLLSQENLVLVQNMSKVNIEILNRKMGRNVQYSPELRKFALTLNFFSPKAYNYVRDVFDTCLPHSKTIAKWFQNADAEPGFTKESINTLRNKVQSSDRPIICSLIIDEIAIRKHLEWDGKKFHGYVNCGTNLNDDSNALAKEAFVIMLVCINGTWKLPVGYFLTDSLNGSQKHSIVSQCIHLIEDTGAKVMSITFDGAPSNTAMCHNFGFLFNILNIQTSFRVTDHNVYIFYDRCHMIKLVRNAFGEKKILIDCDNNFIQWKYIALLEKLQTSEGLHLGNKLRRAHIIFFKQKMKVRLAVQLLSASVADAIEYCEKKLNLEDFKGSQATVKFIRIVNSIFDILNSRNLVAPGYEKALCQKNIDRSAEFINSAIFYLSKLKLSNNEHVIMSNRKTGFIGLIISLSSSLGFYKELVSERKTLLYLPLYKITQDHLELFFSSIRSRGGWNNNPTARQFLAAYKRLLVRAEIREGGMGNCIPLDQIPILSSSTKNVRSEDVINSSLSNHSLIDINEPSDDLETIWKDHDYIMNAPVISECSSQIVQYIAGYVSHQLQKTIKCETCVTALIGLRIMVKCG